MSYETDLEGMSVELTLEFLGFWNMCFSLYYFYYFLSEDFNRLDTNSSELDQGLKLFKIWGIF